ncbi:undecaprenyldiphospho-muramoylpentapeptide beta-N-acetylglucosaminyltransferase [Thiorhodovibrio frisius]|uniref:UDP-N-acetylglucosamine--N-acetylmuramyl-(pentapeptide) pyrophosphoryl-undecaprenol N-acetylglucosamine transferase n=1 Tax=Thiorhodovibrio frisius TaxID=631362 RepID=H8Z3I3_9GAMM|nr:undecaprenyldiphospho-muramoylpentapeptide beta-N-acetylglucosaminyltransferase [Thiorhodovibrio frisius]EIC21891.1 undecaprenyldiphospho-muramoylpentapeptide beta-N-acetylglucosaminyltransferase [Thiorhodovibrio frisius]WPL24180.1 UDP-N-acetylglucosamine--N-acetylmuramyl-(pentapeptide) pyrophosphoryl-undecaprenol N-acetylglucosamine transferase [Thiorhodovibrio frisius]
MAPRIAVMAGGTGGHVFPALAVAHALRARGAEIFWMGTRAGLEARLVPEQGFEIEWLQVQGLRGKGFKTLAMAPWRLTVALREAAEVLRRRAPDLVLGMGGFVSGPGGLMAWRQGRRLVIQEQNSVPGMTNQWLARLADRVFEGFPGSFPPARAAVASGNPVRAEIAALPTPIERWAGRLAEDGHRVRLFVLGGSLGARALNQMVPQALARLPEELRPEVRHQAGERTLELARQAYGDAGVQADIQPFVADMAEAYAWADLMICRAGALTVAEIAAVGVPAIFVPFPYAVDDHQVGNAEYLVRAGAAKLLLESDLSAETLVEPLKMLLTDPAIRLKMAEAARAKAQPSAAARIADACMELVAS